LVEIPSILAITIWRMPGEFDFIDWIRTQQPRSEFVPVPAGDDLAVVQWPGDKLLLVGVDQVLDGVHFDSKIHSPRDIGRKVMNRNLSDCAAMGAYPAAAVATVALPKGVGLEYAKELYLGLRDAADLYECAIIGGDTASWANPLAVTVTLLARPSGFAPVTRSGAKPGDSLYVTGPLGGSILGRHMTFQPRIALGLAIGPYASSMIDLSDGLSRDLSHLCSQSHVGAILDASAIPIHDDAITLFQQDRISPLQHALHDGEDHELLFTSANPNLALPSCICIGTITYDPQILLLENGKLEPLTAKGWQHRLEE
jgi:thiamine-monophosphate kinase